MVSIDDVRKELMNGSLGSALPAVIEVSLGERSYPVFVGYGTRARVAEFLGSPSRKVAVITQNGIPNLLEFDREVLILEIGDGENAKSLMTVAELCSQLSRNGFGRFDTVVALGGGVVSDIAGFVAATYHRGVSYINVATSLLAMVDAAIGGKTGVNLPEGKNLVGAFWQPTAVICDLDFLDSLPIREWACGLGEIAKYRFLGVDELIELGLQQQIEQSVRAKARVVSNDEREGSSRALLNYGHTLAHALETQSREGDKDADIRHGEAVAVGLNFAAQLAFRLGRISWARVEEHRKILDRYGLGYTIPEWAEREKLVNLMRRDKKAMGDLTFVLDGGSGLEVVRNVEENIVVDVLKDL
jgi:5-deoxy-5-amino-3-dehydroquinate synthase